MLLCAKHNYASAASIPYIHVNSIGDVTFSNGEIADYTNATEKNIIIPDNFNGVAVTSIGNLAFYFNQLTEVSIGNSVKSIGNLCFLW